MDIRKEALLKSKQLRAVKLTHIPFGTGLLQADMWSQGCIMEVRSRAPPVSSPVPGCLLGYVCWDPAPWWKPPASSCIPLLDLPFPGDYFSVGSKKDVTSWCPQALSLAFSHWCLCAVLLPHCSREALTYLSFHNWGALHLSSNVSEEKEQGWSTGLGLPGRSKANRAVALLL